MVGEITTLVDLAREWDIPQLCFNSANIPYAQKILENNGIPGISLIGTAGLFNAVLHMVSSMKSMLVKVGEAQTARMELLKLTVGRKKSLLAGKRYAAARTGSRTYPLSL